MSPFEKHLDEDQQDADAAASSPVAWWRRGANLGILQALFAPKNRDQGDLPLGSNSAASSTSPRPRHWTRSWFLTVPLLLLCIPIAAVILAYLRRPAPGSEANASGSLFGSPVATGTKPKPAPGKPFPPPAPEPPAVPAPSTPVRPGPGTAQTVAPQAPARPPVNAPPLATGTPAQPQVAPPVAPSAAFASQTYPARHDRHFGEVCSGQLILNSTGLVFTCPDDPSENIQAPISQVASVDDNGIRLTSGKKYHFTIPGMTKDSERALFSSWLTRVR
jgi:hypothetical protein